MEGVDGPMARGCRRREKPDSDDEVLLNGDLPNHVGITGIAGAPEEVEEGSAGAPLRDPCPMTRAEAPTGSAQELKSGDRQERDPPGEDHLTESADFPCKRRGRTAPWMRTPSTSK